jgi:hypothetical protein
MQMACVIAHALFPAVREGDGAPVALDLYTAAVLDPEVPEVAVFALSLTPLDAAVFSDFGIVGDAKMRLKPAKRLGISGDPRQLNQPKGGEHALWIKQVSSDIACDGVGLKIYGRAEVLNHSIK